MDVTMFDVLKSQGYTPLPGRPDGFGITKAEYAERFHCTIDAARAILDRAVEDGIIEKTVMLLASKTKECVYHRLGEWPPK